MTSRYADVHHPDVRQGPGDARPTALHIIKDNNLEGALTDKVMLITGTSSGIGIETVRALHATGAKVYAAARNLDKARSALADILSSEDGQKVELLQLNTADFASVRRAAEMFLSKEKQLNILICNAGIMALPTRELTKDGHEAQFQTNHLGHFLLFQLLKPAMLAASTPEFNSRVVTVSSVGHRGSRIMFDDLTLGQPGVYAPFVGYGQSKTANIYMANEIERRYGPSGLHAWSLHPGGIRTGLQIHVDLTELDKDQVRLRRMKSPEQGASTTVVAAVDKELEGKGGKYLDDCDVCPQLKEGQVIGSRESGAAVWCYDAEDAKKLWEVSCEIVGVKDV
jgi:NAD(P)-dependent dehydrogenase (short-subunit alcohol dehydrogenase family)